MGAKKQGKLRRGPAEKIALGSAAQRIFLPLVKALRQKGFSLRDIGELVHEVASNSLEPSPDCLSYDLATRVISRWLLDSRFSDANGPRDLSVDGESSFATLAAMLQ